MQGRAVTFAEIEFYGGPWDGRCVALALPLRPSFRLPKVVRLEPWHQSDETTLATEPQRPLYHEYRLRPGPRGLRYELERER